MSCKYHGFLDFRNRSDYFFSTHTEASDGVALWLRKGQRGNMLYGQFASMINLTPDVSRWFPRQ